MTIEPPNRKPVHRSDVIIGTRGQKNAPKKNSADLEIQKVAESSFEAQSMSKTAKSLKLHVWKLLAGFLPRGFAKTISKVLVEAQLVPSISPKYIKQLSSIWMSSLTNEQLSKMKPSEFAALDLNQLHALQPRQLTAIDVDKWKELSYSKLNSLGEKAVGSEKWAQVQGFKLWRVGEFQNNEALKLKALELEIGGLDEKGRQAWLAKQDEKVDFLFSMSRKMHPIAAKLMQQFERVQPGTGEALKRTYESASSQPGKSLVKLGNHDHIPHYGFEHDVPRSDWTVNAHKRHFLFDGKTGKEALQDVTKALYQTFGNDMQLLENFEKIAYQSIAVEALEIITNEYSAKGFHVNHGRQAFTVEVSPEEIHLSVSWHSNVIDPTNEEEKGDFDLSLDIRMSSVALRKPDFSQAKIEYHIGALRSPHEPE